MGNCDSNTEVETQEPEGNPRESLGLGYLEDWKQGEDTGVRRWNVHQGHLDRFTTVATCIP